MTADWMGISSPSCKKEITKWCFIKNCFDWCFAHSAICTGENGQATKHLISQGRTRDGKSTIREYTEEVNLCNSVEAGADCDIFSSGKRKCKCESAGLIRIRYRILL